MEFALNPAGGWHDAVAQITTPLSRGRAQRKAAHAVRSTPMVDALQTLPRGATLAVGQALGQEIFCMSGALWLTHDGEVRDHILVAGRAHTVTSPARLTIHALEDARFIVDPSDR